jgi:hypothetical protein
VKLCAGALPSGARSDSTLQNRADPVIEHLVAQLSSGIPADREDAANELLARSDECAAAIVAVLESERQQRQRRRKFACWLSVSAFAVLMILSFLPWGTYSWMQRAPAGVTVSILLRLAAQTTAVMFLLGGASRRHKSAANLLARIEDVRLVGPLIEASEVSGAVKAALTRLLPRLGPDDAESLNAAQRRILNFQIAVNVRNPDEQTPADAAYILAVLSVLPYCGDSDSVRPVSTLSEYNALTTQGRLIVAAARSCLPQVRVRGAACEAAGTLLRAAAPADSADELLRAAANTSATVRDELLIARSDPAG